MEQKRTRDPKILIPRETEIALVQRGYPEETPFLSMKQSPLLEFESEPAVRGLREALQGQ